MFQDDLRDALFDSPKKANGVNGSSKSKSKKEKKPVSEAPDDLK